MENFTNFRSSTTESVEVHSNLLMKTRTKLRKAPEQKGVLNDRLRQPERVRYEEKSTINLPRSTGLKSDDVSWGIPPAWPGQGLDAIGYLQDS